MGMIKILFVCHGNICRSPMAEFVAGRRSAIRFIRLPEESWLKTASGAAAIMHGR